MHEVSVACLAGEDTHGFLKRSLAKQAVSQPLALCDMNSVVAAADQQVHLLRNWHYIDRLSSLIE